jgi:hypothetical protein
VVSKSTGLAILLATRCRPAARNSSQVFLKEHNCDL